MGDPRERYLAGVVGVVWIDAADKAVVRLEAWPASETKQDIPSTSPDAETIVYEQMRSQKDNWRLDLHNCLRAYYSISTRGSPALISTGSPVSRHAVQPPVRARAFFHPACLSSCATRALVASFVQAQ